MIFGVAEPPQANPAGCPHVQGLAGQHRQDDGHVGRAAGQRANPAEDPPVPVAGFQGFWGYPPSGKLP